MTSADAFDAELAIVSFPRSGRTWLAWQLASYFIDVFKVNETLNFYSLYQLIPGDGAPTEPHEAYASGRIPKVRQLHVQNLPDAAPFVLLFRDPRDAIASYYLHERRQLHLDVGDLSAYADRRAHEWTRFMNGWAERLDRPSALSLSYEERLAAPQATLRRVLERLVATVDVDALRRATANGEFSSMLARELDGPRIPLHDYDPTDRDARRVRRGGIGGWREVLTDADEAAIRSIV
jgi:alcohol sulfotransferase